MASRTYGYARVSARDQNLDRQMDALAAFGVSGERVFADRASGRDFERPEYQRLLGALRRGDVVVVKSIDRFGRNYEEILEEWRRITRGTGCSIVVLDMPLLVGQLPHGGGQLQQGLLVCLQLLDPPLVALGAVIHLL